LHIFFVISKNELDRLKEMVPSTKLLYLLLRKYDRSNCLSFRRQCINRSIIKKSLFITVLFALLVAHSFLSAQDATPFLGTWKGAINAMGQEIGITVEFSLDEAKKISRETSMSPSKVPQIYPSEIYRSREKRYLSRSSIPGLQEIRPLAANWTRAAKKYPEIFLKEGQRVHSP
jgi:hypothetical protein